MGTNPRIVVTGATAGIGEAIARKLAATGATVVLVGRSEQRSAEAVGRIRAAVPQARLEVEPADLSLMAEVRALVERLAAGPPPDVVISNAAVIAPVEETTAEGLQRTVATNHLAPYLLLRSLVEPIGPRPARFVVVGASPTGLRRVPVDLDDLQFTRGLPGPPSLRPFAAYARTKNMNAMTVHALARRLAGSRITVTGAHPGIISGTRLGADARGWTRAIGLVTSRVAPGPDTGADTPTWLATSADVDGVTGRFFVRRRPATTAWHVTDLARGDRLWDESARLVGLAAAVR